MMCKHHGDDLNISGKNGTISGLRYIWLYRPISPRSSYQPSVNGWLNVFRPHHWTPLPAAEGPPWKHTLCCSRKNLRELWGPVCSSQTWGWPTTHWADFGSSTKIPLALLSGNELWKPLLGLLKEAIDLMVAYFLKMIRWTGFPFSLLKESRDNYNSRITISKSFTILSS